MFKVKDVKTNEVLPVLSAFCDEYGKTWFLTWIEVCGRGKWCWRSADKYCPPNYSPKQLDKEVS